MLRYIAAAGVNHLFGYPGDPTVELLESARKQGTTFVLARREGTAGLMAQAYGQITGRPGVCVSTLGPGSTNLVNAVASAYLDRVPMLAISGQIDTQREPYFTHQVIDHNRLFAPVSKWTTTIGPATAGNIMRKALRTAVAERPGPVHISTPADYVGAETREEGIVLPPLGASAFPCAFGGAADQILAKISAARAPVILAGIGVTRSQASDALKRFAESIGAPVVVSPMAKGIIAEDDPIYAGTLDMACNDFIWNFLRKADLILNVGFDAVELIKPWTLDISTIHIDTCPNTDQVYPAEHEIVGDIVAILEELSRSCRRSAHMPDLSGHMAALSTRCEEGRVKGQLNPTDVVKIVREAMPRDTVATTDVGSHKLLVGQCWTTYSPRSLLMTNGLSSMGYSLPAAITSKILNPHLPCVCFVGDGGLAMVQGELQLASSLGLDPLVVVFCDNSLNRIELKQTARQFPSFGTRIESTDIAKLASSMGCDGANVGSARELEQILAQPRSKDRPLVLGLRISPAQYAAQF
jgi:acetolactate synthase-1/2/3 large subunit